MTFFYDINKKLAALDQTKVLTEGAVAEASTGDYSATKARAGKDIGKPGKNFEKIAKSAGERYGSKERGEKVAGAVLAKLRGKNESIEESMANLVREMEMAEEGIEDRIGDLDMTNPVNVPAYQRKAASGDSAMAAKGMPTGKPPKSFADKIAGAKKEVDEMLGDVAAEAIKSALSPKQKKLDKNHNGKLDAQDFAMLRAGKGKQETDEGFGDMMQTAGAKMKGLKANITKNPADRQAAIDAHKGIMKKEYEKMRAAYPNSRMPLSGPGPSKRFDDAEQSAAMHKIGLDNNMEEGWDDMLKDVEKRRGQMKKGEKKQGHKGEIEKTDHGIKHTRRYDDKTGETDVGDDEDKSKGEKRRGRPKGSGKAMGAKGPSGKSKLMTKEGLPPGAMPGDEGEYGNEGDMAKDQIHTIVRNAKDLERILGNQENLPEWVQSKLAKIEGMMTAVSDYMQTQHERDAEMGEEPIAEKAVSQQQQKFMGMVHAMQKGEKVKGASKELKKVAKTMKPKDAEDFAKTKHEGLPKKVKKKEESVEETTSSGSVATADAAPKKSKGGIQIGKGIYDSINREVENLITESMSINVSMTNDDGGSHKNITVTAADEDAEALAQILTRAGLTGGATIGHDDVCPHCGQNPCACDHTMEEAYGDTTATENKPDWPTDTEYSDDALQYSGGLNKPKTTVAGDGQTTVPVTAVQVREDEEDAEKEKCNECGMYEDKCKCSESVEESLARFRSLAGLSEAKKDVEEEKTEEGNLFTGNLAKARAAGKKEADLDGDGDLEKVRESVNNLWKAYKG